MYLKSIEYLPAKKIDFTSAKGKKRKLDEAIETSLESVDVTSTTVEESNNTISIAAPTKDEMEVLFKNLSVSSKHDFAWLKT